VGVVQYGVSRYPKKLRNCSVQYFCANQQDECGLHGVSRLAKKLFLRLFLRHPKGRLYGVSCAPKKLFLRFFYANQKDECGVAQCKPCSKEIVP
jgi:hypothetical protein